MEGGERRVGVRMRMSCSRVLHLFPEIGAVCFYTNTHTHTYAHTLTRVEQIILFCCLLNTGCRHMLPLYMTFQAQQTHMHTIQFTGMSAIHCKWQAF